MRRRRSRRSKLENLKIIKWIIFLHYTIGPWQTSIEVLNEAEGYEEGRKKARAKWFKSGKSQCIKGCKKNRAKRIEVRRVKTEKIERKSGVILTINRFFFGDENFSTRVLRLHSLSSSSVESSAFRNHRVYFPLVSVREQSPEYIGWIYIRRHNFVSSWAGNVKPLDSKAELRGLSLRCRILRRELKKLCYSKTETYLYTCAYFYGLS